jgi:hypothetical protein
MPQYKSPDVVEQLKSATQNSLHLALDTYATREAQILTVSAFGPGPGKLIVIRWVNEDAQKLRDDVVIQCEGLTFPPLRVIVYDAS